MLNALDEIAWLFNLRGSDIPFNPVFFSYGLVTQDQAILYIDATKLTEEVFFLLCLSILMSKPIGQTRLERPGYVQAL